MKSVRYPKVPKGLTKMWVIFVNSSLLIKNKFMTMQGTFSSCLLGWKSLHNVQHSTAMNFFTTAPLTQEGGEMLQQCSTECDRKSRPSWNLLPISHKWVGIFNINLHVYSAFPSLFTRRKRFDEIWLQRWKNHRAFIMIIHLVIFAIQKCVYWHYFVKSN